jgi:phage-related protein
MPAVEVVFFQEEDGSVPVFDWLVDLRRTTPRAAAKCQERMERLQELGHEMRRPEADYLRDDIHELRTRLGRINYRILYFFFRREAVVLAHGLLKEDEVPSRDIDLAVRRREAYFQDPDSHRFVEETDDEAKH